MFIFIKLLVVLLVVLYIVLMFLNIWVVCFVKLLDISCMVFGIKGIWFDKYIVVFVFIVWL